MVAGGAGALSTQAFSFRAWCFRCLEKGALGHKAGKPAVELSPERSRLKPDDRGGALPIKQAGLQHQTAAAPANPD